MNKQERDEYLAAAERVLSQARRAMHYTQIVAVADRYDLLDAKAPTVSRKMSSFLSTDIKINPESRFARERPGVYSLSENTSRGIPGPEHPDQYRYALVRRLVNQTKLPNDAAVLNKSLYLLGRTLDLLTDSEVIALENQSETRRIEISSSDLIDVGATSGDQGAFWTGVMLGRGTLQKAGHIAERLSLEDTQVALSISLFLLDLALDVVAEENLLVLKAGSSSIKMTIKSAR